MTYEDENKKYFAILEQYNATNIERYCLISNWGYTFTIDDKKYDARFWENMYGFSPMRWGVSTSNGDYELAKQIETALNE